MFWEFESVVYIIIEEDFIFLLVVFEIVDVLFNVEGFLVFFFFEKDGYIENVVD